jgi:hypothetical protein
MSVYSLGENHMFLRAPFTLDKKISEIVKPNSFMYTLLLLKLDTCASYKLDSVQVIKDLYLSTVLLDLE